MLGIKIEHFLDYCKVSNFASAGGRIMNLPSGISVKISCGIPS